MRNIAPLNAAGLPTLAEIEASLKPATRAVIGAARPSIDNAYVAFAGAVPDALHALTPADLPQTARSELDTVFKRRLGQFGSLWDALTQHFEDTHDSTCPYCNFGEQWEFDHYLPKSVFPEFSLYPANLIPICKPCNGKKHVSYQLDGERLFIYAYSELEGTEDFLQVEVKYTPRITVSYSLVKPQGMTHETFAVIGRHFEKLELARRYARQASSTIACLVRRFRTPESLGLGTHLLRRRLRQMATDRSDQCPPNHWEASLLKCLAGSAEFTTYIFN